MKKKIAIRAICACLAAVLLAAFPAASALAYEDSYAKNGNIKWSGNENSMGVYTLDSSMNGTTSTLTLFIVNQDVHYINMLALDYRFEGKMNREDKESTHNFEIEIMPINYTTTSTGEMGGQKVNF